MFRKRHLLFALLAIALAPLAGEVLAGESHSHEGHAANAMELRLDAGRKWRGDVSMRQGMIGIRAAMAARLDQIHEDRLAPDEYGALAKVVQKQADYMVENCRLPREVDEQLHIVLGQILEGIGEMEEGPHSRNGAVKIVQALNAYGKHFEHPGWQPLGK